MTNKKKLSLLKSLALGVSLPIASVLGEPQIASKEEPLQNTLASEVSFTDDDTILSFFLNNNRYTLLSKGQHTQKGIVIFREKTKDYETLRKDILQAGINNSNQDNDTEETRLRRTRHVSALEESHAYNTVRLNEITRLRQIFLNLSLYSNSDLLSKDTSKDCILEQEDLYFALRSFAMLGMENDEHASDLMKAYPNGSYLEILLGSQDIPIQRTSLDALRKEDAPLLIYLAYEDEVIPLETFKERFVVKYK